MCCKEDENSSLLLGDLRDYKKSLPPRPPRKEVMDYIKSHFVNDVVKFGPDLSEVGATVDPDKCVLLLHCFGSFRIHCVNFVYAVQSAIQNI